jgi:hypothetical protein
MIRMCEQRFTVIRHVAWRCVVRWAREPTSAHTHRRVGTVLSIAAKITAPIVGTCHLHSIASPCPRRLAETHVTNDRVRDAQKMPPYPSDLMSLSQTQRITKLRWLLLRVPNPIVSCGCSTSLLCSCLCGPQGTLTGPRKHNIPRMARERPRGHAIYPRDASSRHRSHGELMDPSQSRTSNAAPGRHTRQKCPTYMDRFLD